VPPVTVGGGIQASAVYTSPDGGDGETTFPLNSARLYVSGGVMEHVSFMFNSEYHR